MKHIAIVLSLMLALGLGAQAQGNKNFIDQPYIEVTGMADTKVVPNQIYVSIVINEKDTKGKKTVAEMEKQMIDALVRIGIKPDSALTVMDMNSVFDYSWFKANQSRTSKRYQLMVNTAAQLSKAYQALDEVGLSNISLLRTDHSQMQQLKNKLKVQAIKDAQAKAQAMAQALGQSIGVAIYIQDIDYGRPAPMARSLAPMQAMDMTYGEGAGSVQPSDIAFEQIELSSMVNVKFVLK